MNKLYLDQLNKDQLEAIKHFKGPCMVYAGPGSGKTTVITHRVGYLINNYKVEPNNILVISFTKAAADEMRLRFESNYGQLLEGRRSVSFGTFHSTFFRILRSYYRYDLDNILKEGEKYGVIKNIIRSLGVGNYLDDELIKDLILDIGLYKSNVLDREAFIPDSMSRDDFDRVLSTYEAYKDEQNKIDFDDMLTKCYDLLTSNPSLLEGIRNTYKYILIDEFQDINSVQFEIIKLLSKANENLFVVGDDDQSIYSFRGANPNFILEFDKIYKDAHKIVLSLNYRSQENIVSTANKLISNNDFRVDKTMLPTKQAGVDIQFFRPENREEENKYVIELINALVESGYSYKDIAVIYRTNILSSSIVDHLLDNKIPFVSREQVYNIYEHWIAKDLIAYLRAALNVNDRDALRRIINRPTRYITNKARTAADQYHKDYITSLKVKGQLEDYQIIRLDRLEVDLKTISHLSAVDAIKYIREDVGYNDYIEDYCLEKQISCDGLLEILDELEEISARHSTISQFIEHIRDFKESLYESKGRYRSKENQIELLTMHSAKGLEFKVVIIVEAVEDIIPHSKSQDEESLEEERRLFYVAVTRAKERLYIYAPLHKHDKKAKVSRFVEEMEILRDKKDRLKKGQEIIHKIFGKGLIEKVGKNKITAKFYENNQVKELDLNICIERNLIS